MLSGVGGQRRVAVDRKADGRVEIATFGIDGSRNPIDTVTLAQVVFDGLAPAGTVALYLISPREVISQSESCFPALRGAAGEVAVTSASSVAAPLAGATSTSVVVSDPASLACAAALRPRGGTVERVMPVQRGGEVVAYTVKVEPPLPAGSE